jgi:hypothetical protein
VRVILFLLLVGGCALQQAKQQEALPLGPGEILSAVNAANAIAVGKSTKADVRSALGEATVIGFDSGYEVWVYRERPREKAASPRTELVLLFDPSGVLTKTRTR